MFWEEDNNRLPNNHLDQAPLVCSASRANRWEDWAACLQERRLQPCLQGPSTGNTSPSCCLLRLVATSKTGTDLEVLFGFQIS